jgi:RNA 2',3'-cyclic 3'-phosphodiesterase
MRLFIALDIDDAIRERLARLLEGVREFAPDARWVRAESLHVTLKFIGEKPPEALEPIKASLAQAQGNAMEMTFCGYGFFPSAKAPRVFWVGIEAGRELASLATTVDDAMSSLGIPREDHAFSPHLTLARGGKSGAPRWQKGDRSSQDFKRLQEKLAVMQQLEFGTMTAREFFLYESKLAAGGSQYTKLARFELR